MTGLWEEPEEEPRKKRVLSFFSRKKEKEQEWEDEWEALAAPEQPAERTEELPPVPIPLVPAGREKPGHSRRNIRHQLIRKRLSSRPCLRVPGR